MDFRITSTKRGRRGMTLVELMISSVIGAVAAVAIAALVFYTGRSFAAMANYVDLDYRSRIALDKMSREIRQANRVVSCTSTALTLEASDGGTLVYAYDPTAKTLTRVDDGVADGKPLLEECTYIEFNMFQRNPIGGAYDQFPTGTPDTCKLVQLHWVCERRTLGTVVNTESVQSAKVVIRKQ